MHGVGDFLGRQRLVFKTKQCGEVGGAELGDGRRAGCARSGVDDKHYEILGGNPKFGSRDRVAQRGDCLLDNDARGVRKHAIVPQRRGKHGQLRKIAVEGHAESD